jgi:hypothetical protein
LDYLQQLAAFLAFTGKETERKLQAAVTILLCGKLGLAVGHKCLGILDIDGIVLA